MSSGDKVNFKHVPREIQFTNLSVFGAQGIAITCKTHDMHPHLQNGGRLKIFEKNLLGRVRKF